MPSTVHPIRQFLETLHFKMGEMLVICSRMVAMVVVLGAFCSLLMLGGLLMMRHPERVLQTHVFHLNYTEMRKSDNDKAASAFSMGSKRKLTEDPSWDGAIAGFGVGYQIGRMVPVVGVFVGPALGMMMGYQMDEHL